MTYWYTRKGVMWAYSGIYMQMLRHIMMNHYHPIGSHRQGGKVQHFWVAIRDLIQRWKPDSFNRMNCDQQMIKRSQWNASGAQVQLSSMYTYCADQAFVDLACSIATQRESSVSHIHHLWSLTSTSTQHTTRIDPSHC